MQEKKPESESPQLSKDEVKSKLGLSIESLSPYLWDEFGNPVSKPQHENLHGIMQNNQHIYMQQIAMDDYVSSRDKLYSDTSSSFYTHMGNMDDMAFTREDVDILKQSFDSLYSKWHSQTSLAHTADVLLGLSYEYSQFAESNPLAAEYGLAAISAISGGVAGAVKGGIKGGTLGATVGGPIGGLQGVYYGAILGGAKGIGSSIFSQVKAHIMSKALHIDEAVAYAQHKIAPVIGEIDTSLSDQQRNILAAAVVLGSMSLTGKAKSDLVRKFAMSPANAKSYAIKAVENANKQTTLLNSGKGGVGIHNHSKGFYNPRDIELHLEGKYPNKVKSSTLPNRNKPNIKLAGKKHPVTNVVFDKRGFPIFDDKAIYDTRLSKTIYTIKDPKYHMRACTRELREKINSGAIDKKLFNESQLNAIKKGEDKIPGYTWHHHQDFGRMQLISEELHNKTKHIGGMKLWYKK